MKIRMGISQVGSCECGNIFWFPKSTCNFSTSRVIIICLKWTCSMGLPYYLVKPVRLGMKLGGGRAQGGRIEYVARREKDYWIWVVCSPTQLCRKGVY